MPDHVYKSVELTGSSHTTMEEAVENAIARASKSIHKMRWFEVLETRGEIQDGRITFWQVTIKVGFAVED